jgi:hypothetical protein
MSIELIFGAFALLLGLICIGGLTTGVFSRPLGRPAERKTEPLVYWTYVATWGLLALVAALVALRLHLTN